MYDIIIIGSGPAGLTSAIYARRAEKSVLVLEKQTFGGQVTFSPRIENYPGFQSMSGNEFAEKLVEQALALGADIELDEAMSIDKSGDIFTIHGNEADYEGKSVIIAAGCKHRKLSVPDTDRYEGAGLSYCAVCDGAFFAGQDVCVIGGGNTALQDAMLLSDSCRSVTMVQNLSFFTGEQKLIDRLKSKSNVSFITERIVKSVNGIDSVESVTICDENGGNEQTLNVTGIFVAIGMQPENDVYGELAGLDEWGYISSDESCRTATEGLFVAGDCRKKAVRQITTAAADGSVAAIAACRYIDSGR